MGGICLVADAPNFEQMTKMRLTMTYMVCVSVSVVELAGGLNRYGNWHTLYPGKVFSKDFTPKIA